MILSESVSELNARDETGSNKSPINYRININLNKSIQFLYPNLAWRIILGDLLGSFIFFTQLLSNHGEMSARFMSII